MATKTYYRVLGEGLTRREFAEAAEKLGFSKVNHWEGNDEKDYEEGWANANRTRAFNYLEDRFTGLSYVAITATDGDQLLLDLDKEIDLYSPEELIDTAYGSNRPEEQVATLHRLELTFPDFDETVFQILAGFVMTAPHAEVRYAALDAIARHAWPQFKPLMNKVASDDSDPEARSRAKEVLAYWDSK